MDGCSCPSQQWGLLLVVRSWRGDGAKALALHRQLLWKALGSCTYESRSFSDFPEVTLGKIADFLNYLAPSIASTSQILDCRQMIPPSLLFQFVKGKYNAYVQYSGETIGNACKTCGKTPGTLHSINPVFCFDFLGVVTASIQTVCPGWGLL